MLKYKDIVLEGRLSTPKTKTTDPILAEVLAEARADTDLKSKAMEFLKAVERGTRSKQPQGFGGFEVGWAPQTYGGKVGGINILYDVPWEVREDDDDEWGTNDPTLRKKIETYQRLDQAIWQIIHKMNAKNKKIHYGASQSWSGGGVQTTGKPKSSRI